MQDRIIIHLDMDAFFAAIEERENPHFRGKPLVVGADPKEGRGRGVVSTANYEARKFDIHSAMPISQAYKLCPEAVYLPPNFELYSKVSINIMKIIREFSLLVEQASLDEAYLDVTKEFMSTFFAIAKKVDRKKIWQKAGELAGELAEEVKREVWEQEKLTCSCGIGPNKMIAKIACEMAKPNGVKVVTDKEAEKFMEPLDIQKIPGIGVKTAQILRSSGFERVGDLKRLSLEDLQGLFGIRASAMHGYVRGLDEDPVVVERDVKSIRKETTFEKDTRDPELLIQTFEQLAREVAREIVNADLYLRTITVRCRFSGFETHTKSKTLPRPVNDEATLRKEAMKLFLKFLLEKQKPVRLVGVRVVIAPVETL